MLNDVIKSHIAPLLKRYGFKKKEMTWNKTVDGFIQVIDFQVSSYSDEKEETFTINLGVLCPEIWNACWQKEPPKFVKEDDCFPRLRVGQLLGGFSGDSKDQWWVCSTDVNEDVLGEELSVLIESKCLPFIGGMLSKKNINDLYSSSSINLLPVDKVYLAIVKKLVGDKESSAGLLSEVGKISKAWSNRVEIVQSQLS